MKVTLIGMGCGGGEGLSLQGLRALEQADYILGAGRLLEGLPERCTSHRDAAARAEDILALIQASDCRQCCVLYSGDTGFFSGARTLLPMLAARGVRVEVLPGLSSVQYFAAKLGHPWQSWSMYSAHSPRFDPVPAVCGERPVFLLTDGAEGPGRLCQRLTEAGLGGLQVIVGENLGLSQENVYMGTAAECAPRKFSPLNVMLLEPAPRPVRRAPGIPDEDFLWGGGLPVVRQEVRALVLSKLALGPEDVCWDIGAGAGSAAVELALQCREVWAVESRADALPLARTNRENFGAWNLRLTEGTVQTAADQLPKPDAVLWEEGGDALPELLTAVRRGNPQARVCVVTAALETAQTALTELERPEAVQLSVSRTRESGGLHLLLAHSPVFLVSGTAGGE